MNFIKTNIYVFIFLMMGATVFSKGVALVSYVLLFILSLSFYKKNIQFSLDDFKKKKNLHIFIAFILLSLVSGANGINPSKSLIAMSAFVIYTMSFYPVRNFLINIDDKYILNLPKIVVYIISPFCLYLTIREIWLFELFDMEFKRHFPMVMTLLSPFFWFYFIKNNNKISSYIILANFVLALIIGDNRGAMLATLIGAAIFAFLYGWKDKRQLLKISLYGLLLILISSVIYIKTNPKALSRLTDLSVEHVGSGRNVLWKFSVDKIAERPLLGYGAKTFKYQDFTGYAVNTKTHPHNIILETILENGFIGFFVILLWLYNLFLEFKRTYNKNNEQSTIFMLLSLSFLLYFILNITSVSIHRVWFTIFPLYFLIMASVVKEKIEIK